MKSSFTSAVSTKGLACIRAGQASIFEFELAVYEHILHALGELRRSGVGGFVDDGLWIEDSDVGEIAFSQQAAVGQVLALRR